jgi:GTP cyclohydrolase II
MRLTPFYAVQENMKNVSDSPAATAEAAHEECVELVAKATIPTRYGVFESHVYRVKSTGAEHLTLVMGDVAHGESVLCRLHSECVTGDVFGSYRCDCGEQLDLAMRYIAAENRGILLYLRGHEGRGIGLANKIRAYALQEQGYDTVDANLHLGLPDDAREYDSAAAILRALDVRSVRLMSNNPSKFDTLLKHDIPVCERVALAIPVREENERYIKTKQVRFGHYFDENE